MADTDAIAEFLDVLFGDGTGARIMVVSAVGFTEDGRFDGSQDYREAAFPYPAKVAEAAAWLADADADGLNAFVEATARHSGEHRRRAPHGGEPQTFGRVLRPRFLPRVRTVLSVPNALAVPTDPAPTLALDVGGDRYQCHWRLSAPVAPATDELSNLRVRCGLSHEVSAIPQTVRPPTTRNFTVEGHPVVTVSSDHPERVYDVAEAIAAHWTR